MKELAIPRLARATVHDYSSGQLVHDTHRVSKSAWLEGWEHEVADRLNKRIDMMTNLEMSTAEDLQVQNYGVGGHYIAHFDHLRKDDSESFKSFGTGNRIATVLFYVSLYESCKMVKRG
ncbi:4-hydroxylase alpha subunit, partial [Trichostrongylus colubriformis]